MLKRLGLAVSVAGLCLASVAAAMPPPEAITLTPRLMPGAPLELVIFRSQGQTIGGKPGQSGRGRAGGVIEVVEAAASPASAATERPILRWTPLLDEAVTQVERAGASPPALASSSLVLSLHRFGLEFVPQFGTLTQPATPTLRNHAALFERVNTRLDEISVVRGPDRPTIDAARAALTRAYGEPAAASAALLLDQARYFALVWQPIPVEGGNAGERAIDLGPQGMRVIAKGRWEILEGDPRAAAGTVRVRLTWRADLGSVSDDLARRIITALANSMIKTVPEGEAMDAAIRAFRLNETWDMRFDLAAGRIDWLKFDRAVRALGEQHSEQQVFRRVGLDPQPGDPDEPAEPTPAFTPESAPETAK